MAKTLDRFRPRFTVRRLMILVAVVALIAGAVAGVDRRSRRFEALMMDHLAEALVLDRDANLGGQPMPHRRRFHVELCEKYSWASHHPWFPVPPDPPEPE